MNFVHACTFGYCSPRNFTSQPEWRDSLQKLVETTECDTVVIPVVALQDHTYSTQIDYETDEIMSFDDVRRVAAEVRSYGKKVILKAMVNCRDGYWRAFIRFFDTFVPTEPTWQQWFDSYNAFCWALAGLAEELKAELFCIGCEMVGTDHCTDQWKALIDGVRTRYHGHITYNCDKYQEDHVTWWNLVDVISASGYYPINDLTRQFARIREVAQREGKPFLFMECGCPSRKGSEFVPNDWRFGGEQDNESQRIWFEAFTEEIKRSPWIQGVAWWDWSAVDLYPEAQGANDDGYAFYAKPAGEYVRGLGQWAHENA